MATLLDDDRRLALQGFLIKPDVRLSRVTQMSDERYKGSLFLNPNMALCATEGSEYVLPGIEQKGGKGRVLFASHNPAAQALAKK